MEQWNYTGGFLTPQEVETHLYKEAIDTISREDDTILLAAIDAAVQEAAGYLGAYDRAKIFNQPKPKRRNELLLTFVKDIAVWHFVNLCNAGAELELKEKRYDRAIAWLRQVQNFVPTTMANRHQRQGNPFSDSWSATTLPIL